MTKCTKKFIDSHDEVCLINYIIYNGYEHLVSDHADYMFGNRTSFRYSPQQVDKLGLKEMIFTGKINQSFDSTNPKVKVILPTPNLRDEMMGLYGFDPASGIQALHYFLKRDYDKISLIGFDFYEVGSTPYYFKPSEATSEQKYLWSGDYKDNKINVASGHDTTKSIDYLEKVITDNPQIEFNLITHSKRVNGIEGDNVNIVELDDE